ncbi:MAG: hypothetical protein HY010_10715 [Acidobacteria bacterium]|nr:hypothetical protein [Acidobacteriota bacterium]
MSSLRGRLNTFSAVFGFAVLLSALVVTTGCSGALGSHQVNRDPLGLGVVPGPLGSPDPQTIEVRVGSVPTERIVSLSLTMTSLKATNSGAQDLELLTAPITVEFTRSAIVTEPVVVRDIYQDTYSALVLPDMTGQVVFFDNNGQLTSQTLNITGQTIALSPNLVLGTDAQVFNVSLDLAQSFTVNTDTVTINSLVATTEAVIPAPPVAPAVGQPESGSVAFLVGTVTAVDTNAKVISLQPPAGNEMQIAYDNNTVFANCDPAALTGMMVETQAETQTSAVVLATQVALIENSASSSELYGTFTGLAPDGMNYNFLVDGGMGVNYAGGLLGKNITVDWLATGYSVNAARLDLSGSTDLVFDEVRIFPGQSVEVKWDTLIVPDPDAVNAGFMSPRMIELEEQTVTGQVSSYNALLGTFTLDVPSDSAIRTMNTGLISISVRQVPQTYLRNSPTFNDGDAVKVRGLIFVHPDYSYVMQHPGDPLVLVMVADRISK